MPLTGTDWAAIVGAAAWLPQIGSWVRDYLQKPKPRLFVAGAPEVGYSILGPILNLSCAFATDRVDAVVERMRATIRHQSGATVEMRWIGLLETLSELQSSSGETETARKAQIVLALKVGVKELTERTVRFNDLSFQASGTQLWRQLEARREAVRRIETDLARIKSQTLQSDEYLAVVDHLRNGLFWREGAYDMAIEMTCTGLDAPIINHFTFTLFQPDIQNLRANVATLEASLPLWLFGDVLKLPDMNWRYPSMQPSADAPTAPNIITSGQ
jgi:hypothetical protein